VNIVIDRNKAPVPIKADERHVPGAGQRHDVVQQEEGQTSDPRQLPTAAQHVRRVDADEQSDDEVGERQVEDEVVAERAQLAVDGEGEDDQSVSGNGDDADQPDQRRQNDKGTLASLETMSSKSDDDNDDDDDDESKTVK